MFINCTNHPYKNWNAAQKEAAGTYGEVVEIPFPQISPNAKPDDIRKLVKVYGEKIVSLVPDAVLVAGEFTFCFMLADYLLKRDINVLAACAKRVTVERQKEDGTNEKTAVFSFEGFRKYEYF